MMAWGVALVAVLALVAMWAIVSHLEARAWRWGPGMSLRQRLRRIGVKVADADPKKTGARTSVRAGV